MNALKAQQDLLASALRARDVDNTLRAVCWQEDPHGRGVCLFHRGVVGYFIQRDDLLIDTRKLPCFDKPLPYGFAGIKDNLLTPTDEVRLMPEARKVRIYNGRNGRTGIDQALLKHFELSSMKLYQLKPHGPILVVERQSFGDITVGIVMPYRI
jgi:hypothetical protein